MRVLELFAGAGGMALGFHRAGFDTVALAEWDDHARCVLRERFPDVPLYGDVTQVDGREVVSSHGDVDLVSGGAPCQDLSVAGKRAGLEGSRSILFYDLIRIWEETGATYCLYENVCGALSSNKGADFAAVLSAFVGADVPVPSKGWKGGGGVVAGPTGVAAWRVLDAQFFGVPQRRRRVFVLGARPGGVDPAAVLLEWEGMPWDSPAGVEAGQGSPGAAVDRLDGRGGGGEALGEVAGEAAPKDWPARIASGLTCAYATKHGLEDQHINDGAPLFVSDGQAEAHVAENLAGTLNAQHEQPDIVPAHTYSTPAIGHIKEDRVASAIGAHTGGGGETQNPALVIQGEGEIVGALTAKGPGTNGAPEIDAGHIIVPALPASGAGSPRTGNERTEAELVVVQEAVGYDRYNDALTGAISPPIQAANSGRIACASGCNAQAMPVVGRPRRLLPIECERLMSWPDGWTDVIHLSGLHKVDCTEHPAVEYTEEEEDDDGNIVEVTKIKRIPAIASLGDHRTVPCCGARLKQTEMADAHRYKMCGNGVVSHVAEWIGRQLLWAEATAQ